MYDALIALCALSIILLSVAIPTGILIYVLTRSTPNYVFSEHDVDFHSYTPSMTIDGRLAGSFTCCGCGRRTYYDLACVDYATVSDNDSYRHICAGNVCYLEPEDVVCNHCGAKFTLNRI